MSIPIVALTAHVVAGAKEKFQAAGMNGFVEKPIDTELLFKTIEEHTGTPLTCPDFVSAKPLPRFMCEHDPAKCDRPYKPLYSLQPYHPLPHGLHGLPIRDVAPG